MTHRLLPFAGPLALAVSVTDCATKRMVEDTLVPHVPHHVLGDFFRFTLPYNRVGAMGISLGD